MHDSAKVQWEQRCICMWLFKAEVYAEQFGFGEVLSENAEANLPAAEGPRENVQEIDAVECN
jgi:hypothetical protein